MFSAEDSCTDHRAKAAVQCFVFQCAKLNRGQRSEKIGPQKPPTAANQKTAAPAALNTFFLGRKLPIHFHESCLWLQASIKN